MQQLGGRQAATGSACRCACRCAGLLAGSALAAILLATPAAALVYVLPTDESMVERSEVIVFGEVLRAAPAPDGRLPSTDFAVAVEDVLKGTVPGGTIIVRQPGGASAGGIAMKVLGLPMLAEGDRVLLFLDRANDVYRPVELALGMFFEVRSGQMALLMREPSLRGEVTMPADPAAAERARSRLPRDAERFRRWVAERAAGLERPADYFVAEPPGGPRSLARPFRVTRSPAECFRAGLPLRWQEFDHGQSVGMTVQSGGQPGVPGGGLAEVRAAMRAWNNVSRSRVNLTLQGTSSREFPVGSDDGVNSISYEDPFDEIEGSYERGEGGVIAIAHTFFYCGALTAPHEIPGNESVEALAIIEANLTTQDGYEQWVRSTPNPRKAHEEIVGHELGHVIGISHPCGDDASGPCDDVTDDALMRAKAHGDGRGARLNSDDRAAARFLYPVPGADPEPDPAPDPEPPPEPDPEPDPTDTTLGPLPDPPQGLGYTDCRPETASLVFDGGFKVAVCYETAGGEIGEGKAGIWASSESGLLWFFNRDNAEVLVKVLDGCHLNGHRWVYVAPVTDLAFNLYVQSPDGTNWSHHNRLGETAASRSDNFAFPCN
ncbi:MAG: hypothetical protein OYL92_17495 [Acidobacteriota bacterium]|nr:hypothetical protein [Acidobacteriota bacterium]MDE3266764.1 hypothetical protein [Acidobacteriota bacterium]